MANVWVRYANQGAATATSAVLTASLPGDLTYVGDTSGMASTMSGDTIPWHLPDLAYQDSADSGTSVCLWGRRTAHVIR